MGRGSSFQYMSPDVSLPEAYVLKSCCPELLVPFVVKFSNTRVSVLRKSVQKSDVILILQMKYVTWFASLFFLSVVQYCWVVILSSAFFPIGQTPAHFMDLLQHIAWL